MAKARTTPIYVSPQDAALAFYQAFEARDLDAMMTAWADDEDIVCVHPGGARMVGYDAVRAAWEQLFSGDTKLSFRLDEVVILETVGLAMQSAIEHVATADGTARGAAVATNVFMRTPSGWRMVCHHASPIANGRACTCWPSSLRVSCSAPSIPVVAAPPNTRVANHLAVVRPTRYVGTLSASCADHGRVSVLPFGPPRVFTEHFMMLLDVLKSSTHMVSRLFIAALAGLLFAGSAMAQNLGTTFTDLWYTPGEDGWGVTIDHQQNVMFLTFYIYRADRSPYWVTAVLTKVGTGGLANPPQVFTGNVFEDHGPWFGDPFNPRDRRRDHGRHRDPYGTDAPYGNPSIFDQRCHGNKEYPTANAELRQLFWRLLWRHFLHAKQLPKPGSEWHFNSR